MHTQVNVQSKLLTSPSLITQRCVKYLFSPTTYLPSLPGQFWVSCCWFDTNLTAGKEWLWPTSPVCTRCRCQMTTSTRWSCWRWRALMSAKWPLWPPMSLEATAAASAWRRRVGRTATDASLPNVRLHVFSGWNSVHSSTNVWDDHGRPGRLCRGDSSLCSGRGGQTCPWHPLVQGGNPFQLLIYYYYYEAYCNWSISDFSSIRLSGFSEA